MKSNQIIIQQYFKSIGSFNEIEKTPKDFGTGDSLYSSEIHTLKAIGDYPGSNLTEIANHMDITKGGVSKFVKKLLSKELILKENRNKKEVIFFLTDKGMLAYKGHEAFGLEMFGKIHDKLDSMQEDDKQVLVDYLGELNNILDESLKKLDNY